MLDHQAAHGRQRRVACSVNFRLAEAGEWMGCAACWLRESHNLRAVAAVDRWVDEQLTRGGSDAAGPGVVARACDALLGIAL